MAVKLVVSSEELVDEDLQVLAADLCKSISRETDIDAKLPEGSINEKAKGEPITLGVILLYSIKFGALAALFGVLKSYFERESSLEVNIQRDDGVIISINAKNMHTDQIERTFKKVNEFLGKP